MKYLEKKFQTGENSNLYRENYDKIFRRKTIDKSASKSQNEACEVETDETKSDEEE